jgi:dTDP-4-amino-4,6-dideoxygalactose transaminase
VVTVPNTFIATAEAISWCGATPVFVDIDEQMYTMDPLKIESAITPRTKAIVPVHLFGQMADMEPIVEIARAHGLWVIEDACQAHGAEYKGMKAGSMGDIGCFSFYPSKNLGAYGEAGAVVTNRPEWADRMRMVRDHGQIRKHDHSVIGWNARMDGIQAAILSVKLKHLPRWNAARQRHAHRYSALFKGLKRIVTPREAEHAKHVYHLYVLRVKHRDRLIASLSGDGIQCGIHYPVPIHLQEAYRFLNLHEGSYPVTEQCARELISLPMYPELTDEQIEWVGNEVKRHTLRQG